LYSDYEREVLCADSVINRHCGDRTARLMARVIRMFLKNSQETSNCYGIYNLKIFICHYQLHRKQQNT